MIGKVNTVATRPRYGNWPSASQEDLIRAAVTGGQESIDAWRTWISTTDFDDIEYESFRMIGLIYNNLSKAGAQEPNLARMKGIFRRTWYKNQVLLNRLVDVVRLFRENNIDLLVIKGAPISLLYYENSGSRQMYDLDILVHPDDAVRAIRLLESAGWEMLVSPSYDLNSSCLSANYATHLKDDNGIELDLHWFATKSCRFRSADSNFWTRSVPVEMKGEIAKTLDATGHLLHICVHGVASHNTSALRWVTDALIILKADANIDWSYLEAEINRRQLYRLMEEALRYLRDVFGAPIPDDMLDRIHGQGKQKRQALELWASTRIEKYSFAAIASLWVTYARREQGDGVGATMRGFSQFLKCVWEVDSSRELPLIALKKFSRRFKDRIKLRWSHDGVT